MKKLFLLVLLMVGCFSAFADDYAKIDEFNDIYKIDSRGYFENSDKVVIVCKCISLYEGLSEVLFQDTLYNSLLVVSLGNKDKKILLKEIFEKYKNKNILVYGSPRLSYEGKQAILIDKATLLDGTPILGN